MKNFVNIQPEMLRWAIGRAGFTVEGMTEKVPQLSAWLDGTKQRRHFNWTSNGMPNM